MNSSSSLFVSLSVVAAAIVLNGLKTIPKPIASSLAKPSNAAVRPAVRKAPLKPKTKTSVTSKQQRSRKRRKSLTLPPSKHAKLLGKKMDLGTAGKWTIVHFWATWCGACVEISPDLVKLHDKYATQGVDFVGVNLDKNPQAMSDYMAKSGMHWPQVITSKGWHSPLRIQYEIPSIPAIYLVTPEGHVIEAGLKSFQDADARLQHHLESK